MENSISDMVNDAVKTALTEDAVDLESFAQRKSERSQSFETFVSSLKRRGLL